MDYESFTEFSNLVRPLINKQNSGMREEVNGEEWLDPMLTFSYLFLTDRIVASFSIN